MRKMTIISGCLVLIFAILFLTGTIDLNNQVKHSLNKGNQLFRSEKYDEALSTYQQGIEVQPEDERLNYNAAQTGYCLGDYQQAIQYYAKAANDLNKYMNLGNANLKLGDRTDDENQKMQYYQQAVESYKNGILSNPQNVDIKYNYEVAKNKLDELSQNLENQQQQDQQQEDNEQQNQEQNQEGDQDNQSEENDSSDESQQQENDEQQSESDESQQQENQSEDSQESNDDGQDNESSQNMSESEQEIAQILDLLEKQEQDSLKNNQEVKEANTEEDDDW